MAGRRVAYLWVTGARATNVHVAHAQFLETGETSGYFSEATRENLKMWPLHHRTFEELYSEFSRAILLLCTRQYVSLTRLHTYVGVC